MKTIKLAMAMALGCLTTGAANAAVFTKSYILTSTTFIAFNGPTAAPYEYITQSFTLTFDPSSTAAPVYANYNSNTGGVFANLATLHNYRVDGNIIYFSLDQTVGSDGYVSQFSTNLRGDARSFEGVSYSIGRNHFGASAGTLAEQATAPVTPVASVPEPATWTMMTLGFGAIGFAMRRKQTATRIRFA